MDISQSTIDRGHVNILVWPAFGGLCGWFSIAPGVTVQAMAPNLPAFQARLNEGWNELWDHIDRTHEDEPELYRKVWRYKALPTKLIQIPAAPPYLAPGALEHFFEQAYSRQG